MREEQTGQHSNQQNTPQENTRNHIKKKKVVKSEDELY